MLNEGGCFSGVEKEKLGVWVCVCVYVCGLDGIGLDWIEEKKGSAGEGEGKSVKRDRWIGVEFGWERGYRGVNAVNEVGHRKKKFYEVGLTV